ncbi:hypothetical protein GUITHDRAFT_67304 [Guillardia theta CCMP2712]|uniref:JmjC domain-containing protein n=1 Tax=Guillardia theta (strain CCMP2712) TaxID=905079 RepID=L1JND6_GUITC|nr:hypothetical protein GUITHDRAFT_67304 [Guillardia theta CCMP2712]EKX49962.1 hypothetical protein GUITHDRAFT_67304 [Guillardia theta CCMP2712]|eukprot:XP_005836942.1 hypothetical protein GUITHDRAFT_67304 [Guillardia theta CCMP2712]
MFTLRYGVEPWGNFYGSARQNGGTSIRDTSLGRLAALDDQSLLEVLGLLSYEHLLLVCMTSRALYVFGHHDELWRTLALNYLQGDFQFADSWKSTLGRKLLGKRFPGHRPLTVKGLYSDLLFQPWLCATVGVLPEWLEVSNIERRDNLTLESFIDEYERRNRPVIVTDVVKHWPAFKKWNREYLLENFGEKEFEVGPVKMKMNNFYHYCDHAKEEKPLYLFDKDFPVTCPSLVEDYEVPEYFKQDFFEALGDSRPNWRWIIIGPARSGSSFHIDPNSTSAWNAVISGRKKWIMFPPGQRPPGVFPSADMANVATSASIWEWFLNFYPATKSCKVRPLECVCEAGEIIFVPNGWWHCVLNLEPSVAITQNYVRTSRHIVHV